MKRFKIIGLCLMAAFVVAAVVASAASAAKPEWLGYPLHFTSLGVLLSKLKAGGTSVTCTHVDNLGFITGPQSGWVLVTFLGCKLASKFACKSASANEEEIKTSLLNMTLGYVNKKNKEAGVALAASGSLAEFSCNDEGVPFPAVVKGSVIGAITTPNVKASEFKLTFAESGGKQAIQEFEKESKDTLEVSLNGGVFEEGVETSEDTITTAGLMEVMA
jgi:hypothetical protein